MSNAGLLFPVMIWIMMAAMKLRATMAGFVAAAVMALAIMFAPQSAQAHPGHDHRPRPAQMQTSAPTDQLTVRPSKHQPQDRAAVHEQHTSLVSGLRQSSKPHSGCTGVCCGNGVSCCTAILNGPQADILDLGRSLSLRLSDVTIRAAPHPGGLRRPPRVAA